MSHVAQFFEGHYQHGYHRQCASGPQAIIVYAVKMRAVFAVC